MGDTETLNMLKEQHGRGHKKRKKSTCSAAVHGEVIKAHSKDDVSKGSSVVYLEHVLGVDVLGGQERS